MKLLTVGIRRNGNNRRELQQQITAIDALPEIRFDLAAESSGASADVLFAGWYPEDEEVPQILERLMQAGFELTSLSYNPVTEETQPALPASLLEEPRNSQRNLLETLLRTLPASRKINLPTLHGFRRFELNTIIRFESTDNYTNVYFTNRKKLLVCRPLHEFELQLATAGFFRVHHQHLINTEHIEEYHKGKGGQVILSDGTAIDVSVRRKTDFIRYINALA